MFCRKCGNLLPDDAVFCNKCGSKQEKNTESGHTPTASPSAQDTPAPKGNQTGQLSCPHCGGQNCHVTVKTKVSGGGFGFMDGCCGYILLGPFGLLCGMKKAKSENETWWNCADCGTEFMPPSAVKERVENAAASVSLCSLICALFTAAYWAEPIELLLSMIPIGIAVFLWRGVWRIPETCGKMSMKEYLGSEGYERLKTRWIPIGVVVYLLVTLVLKNWIWS